MKTQILVALSLMISVNAFAFSGSGHANCQFDDGSRAVFYTPVRAWGLVTKEDAQVLKDRCEALGGELGEIETIKPGQIPPGAK